MIEIEYNEPQINEREDFYKSQNFDFSLLKNRKQIISTVVPDTSAATAANYGVFFIAPFPCRVSSIREVHKTAGNDAGAVTLTVEKLTGTQALDAGVSVMTGSFNLKGTANTVQTATLTATIADLNLATGDRLALDDAGTLANVAHVAVTLEITF